jgi:GAF domain-containing protein
VRDAYKKKLPQVIWWHIDLARLPIDDVASLFATLATDGASLFPGEASRWSILESDSAFYRALVGSIASVRRPLVLAIDHLESAPLPVAQTVVHCVRWLYSRRDEPSAPQALISVVMSGSRRLRRQGEGRGSPLNFARVHYVQDLESEVAVQMLLSAAEGQPWRFDVDAANYLADETGGDKYLLQRIAYDCVASLAENDEATIDLNLVQGVVLNFIVNGFRDDPKLGQLLPALVLDRDGLDIVLELAGEPDTKLPSIQLLRADIAPRVCQVLNQNEDFVVIRNNIYRRIISEHVPILAAVRRTIGRTQQGLSRAHRLQQLTSLVELTSTEHKVMKSVLTEIGEFAQAKVVHLFVYDEALRWLVHSDSTTDHTLLSAVSALPQDRLINALQDAMNCVRCQAVVEQCLHDECLGSESGDCSIVPLMERSANRLVGALVLVDQPLVMSPQLNKELMELGVTLAVSLQRQRHLAGLRLLSRIRVDMPHDEVQREICEVTSFLFNKPFAFLWQGSIGWPPLPLQAAVGVGQKRFAELGLMPHEALYPHRERPGPRTLLVSSDHQGNVPIPPDVMLDIGLDHMLLVSFLMQDNQVGVLGVGSFDRWQPTDEEITLAQLVAKQATVILQNLRVYHQIQRRLESSQLAVSLLPHELKRRPRAVGGELELLLSGKEGLIPLHQRKLLERVQEYVEEHERLIDTILDAVRLDADVFQATMSVQPILPVLRNVLSRLAAETEGADMQLVTDFAADLPPHRLDPLLA